LSPLSRSVALIVALAGCGRIADEAPPAPASDTSSSLALCRPAPFPRSDRIALGVALPDLFFPVGERSGVVRSVPMHEYHRPCAAGDVLVIRVQAAFSGTSRWHAAHTGRVLAAGEGHAEVLDVLVAGDDADPTRHDLLSTWRASQDVATDRVVDESFQLRALFAADAPFPKIARIARATMIVRDVLTNPDPALLDARVRSLAVLPRTATAPRHDDRFDDAEWDLLGAMRAPAGPPPDPSNAHADDPAAAALGQALFADPSLSPSGRSCATCHQPDRFFTDGLATSTNVGARNATSPCTFHAIIVSVLTARTSAPPIASRRGPGSRGSP